MNYEIRLIPGVGWAFHPFDVFDMNTIPVYETAHEAWEAMDIEICYNSFIKIR